jgi:putative acetyltransferase
MGESDTGPNIEIRRENIASPVVEALIRALNAELSRMYPEEGATHFGLDPDEVAEGRGAFLVAYAEGNPVACGALRRLDADSAEIKRMYVGPGARGRGIGRAVLAALEAEARRLGVRRIVLETGTRQTEALALYAKAGFERIPLFGEYIGSPLTSVCMAKDLVSSRSGDRGDVTLRDVTEADLPILFEHQRDPEALRMAAFPSRDWEAFTAHWTKILGDETLVKKTILSEGQVAGHIGCFERDGEWEVGYWIGREYWGKGIATRALSELLGLVQERPLVAHVAKHNPGSIRVLEKCGFTHAGEDKEFSTLDGIAVEGLILKLV